MRSDRSVLDAMLDVRFDDRPLVIDAQRSSANVLLPVWVAVGDAAAGQLGGDAGVFLQRLSE